MSRTRRIRSKRTLSTRHKKRQPRDLNSKKSNSYLTRSDKWHCRWYKRIIVINKPTRHRSKVRLSNLNGRAETYKRSLANSRTTSRS
jgi:hypothetical protein